MKKIRYNRYGRPVKSRTPRYGCGGESEASGLPEFTDYRANVDADGRDHFTVPLMGPKRQAGKPYLIAHFSSPPANEREALIEELARNIARSAVDELLRKLPDDRFID